MRIGDKAAVRSDAVPANAALGKAVLCAVIIGCARGIDLGAMFDRPNRQRRQPGKQALTKRAQDIVDARWRSRCHDPFDQTIALQFAQCLGQHLLRDIRNIAAQLGKAARRQVQRRHHQDRPFVADTVQHLPHRAGRRIKGNGGCLGCHCLNHIILTQS